MTKQLCLRKPEFPIRSRHAALQPQVKFNVMTDVDTERRSRSGTRAGIVLQTLVISGFLPPRARPKGLLRVGRPGPGCYRRMCPPPGILFKSSSCSSGTDRSLSIGHREHEPAREAQAQCYQLPAASAGKLTPNLNYSQSFPTILFRP